MNATQKKIVLTLAAAVTCAAFGCKKTADNNVNFTSAINTFYNTRPVCLWADSIKFPQQVTTSDTSQTQPFDALVDQGLLTRSTAEKKVFILGSKQVTNYDLSDKGRSAWTPDPQQPGAGNFCVGKPTVTSIDSSTPTSGQPGDTTTVNFHYQVSGAPAWATAPETETAFPPLRTVLAGPLTGVATLTDTNNGWAVTTGPADAYKGATFQGKPVTKADGSIVQ